MGYHMPSLNTPDTLRAHGTDTSSLTLKYGGSSPTLFGLNAAFALLGNIFYPSPSNTL